MMQRCIACVIRLAMRSNGLRRGSEWPVPGISPPPGPPLGPSLHGQSPPPLCRSRLQMELPPPKLARPTKRLFPDSRFQVRCGVV